MKFLPYLLRHSRHHLKHQTTIFQWITPTNCSAFCVIDVFVRVGSYEDIRYPLENKMSDKSQHTTTHSALRVRSLATKYKFLVDLFRKKRIFVRFIVVTIHMAVDDVYNWVQKSFWLQLVVVVDVVAAAIVIPKLLWQSSE